MESSLEDLGGHWGGRHSTSMMTYLVSREDFLGTRRLDMERLKVQGQENVTS